jgi:hypothetical protein
MVHSAVLDQLARFRRDGDSDWILPRRARCEPQQHVVQVRQFGYPRTETAELISATHDFARLTTLECDTLVLIATDAEPIETIRESFEGSLEVSGN